MLLQHAGLRWVVKGAALNITLYTQIKIKWPDLIANISISNLWGTLHPSSSLKASPF